MTHLVNYGHGVTTVMVNWDRNKVLSKHHRLLDGNFLILQAYQVDQGTAAIGRHNSVDENQIFNLSQIHIRPIPSLNLGIIVYIRPSAHVMTPKIIRKKTQRNEIIFFDSKLKVWDLRLDCPSVTGRPRLGTVRRSLKDIKEAIESYIYNSITYEFISHKIKSGEIFYSKLALDMAKKIYFKRIKSHQNQSQVLIGQKV